MSKQEPTRSRILALWSRTVATSRPSSLLPTLIIGLVSAIINLIVAISLSALLFTDDLSSYVAHGIGFILLGGSIAIVITGLLSSAPGTITVSQDAPTAILAVVGATIVQSLPVWCEKSIHQYILT